MYIEPGAPWENEHIESFHDKQRDECLNRELFRSVAEARVIVESWRVEYNERLPHSALGYLTPEEYTNRVDGAARPQTPRRSPRQAFGGNLRRYRADAASQQAKRKTTLRNSSLEVSNQRGQASPPSCGLSRR
jgi:hypothetical protein